MSFCIAVILLGIEEYLKNMERIKCFCVMLFVFLGGLLGGCCRVLGNVLMGGRDCICRGLFRLYCF